MIELGLEWVGGADELKILLRKSDFVVLCLPVTAESKDLMNPETFACMKPSAFLINIRRVEKNMIPLYCK